MGSLSSTFLLNLYINHIPKIPSIICRLHGRHVLYSNRLLHLVLEQLKYYFSGLLHLRKWLIKATISTQNLFIICSWFSMYLNNFSFINLILFFLPYIFLLIFHKSPVVFPFFGIILKYIVIHVPF